MKVEGHSRLSPVIDQADVDVVLLRNQHGDPILLAIQYDENTVILEHAGSDLFESKLKLYGIDKGPLVKKLHI